MFDLAFLFGFSSVAFVLVAEYFRGDFRERFRYRDAAQRALLFSGETCSPSSVCLIHFDFSVVQFHFLHLPFLYAIQPAPLRTASPHEPLRGGAEGDGLNWGGEGNGAVGFGAMRALREARSGRDKAVYARRGSGASLHPELARTLALPHFPKTQNNRTSGMPMPRAALPARGGDRRGISAMAPPGVSAVGMGDLAAQSWRVSALCESGERKAERKAGSEEVNHGLTRMDADGEYGERIVFGA
jgi:hypothetical protein